MNIVPKVIDLFSGAGGLSLGAARAGFNVCGAVETDKEALATHSLNFQHTTHIEKDVSNLTGKRLKELLEVNNGDLSGIVGGPPCQGFSSIGRQSKKDPRNKLFVDFFRIVEEALPKFFLAENVPGIMNSKNTELRTEAFSCVESKYTLLPPMVLTASDYGAPTTRTRVFFFGYRPDAMNSLSVEDFEPPVDAEVVRVCDALKGLPVKIKPYWQKEADGWRVARVYGNGKFNSRLKGRIPHGVGNPSTIKRLKNESRASGCLGTFHSKEVEGRYAKVEPGMRDLISKSYRLKKNGFCPTLRAGTGSDRGSFQAVRPLHPTESRVITPREAARLQGFPDWFQFAPTKWHSFRQIGNSVSPILAEHILRIIRKAVAQTIQ